MEVKYILSITILLLLVCGEVDSKVTSGTIKSLGCYGIRGRYFPMFSQVETQKKTVNSVEACVLYCGSHGFKLAGIQNGNLCKCQKSQLNNYSKKSGCSKKCVTDGKACGAWNRISVYTLDIPKQPTKRTTKAPPPTKLPKLPPKSLSKEPPKSEHPEKIPIPDEQKADHGAIISLGCYRSKGQDKQLFIQAGIKHKTVTSVEACVLYCTTYGYRLAGIQNGGLCQCGNSSVAESDKRNGCNRKCADDEKLCGGNGALSVYTREYYSRELGCYNVYRFTVKSTAVRRVTSRISECISHCFRSGYRYAGLKGTYCKCNTNFNALTNSGKSKILQGGCMLKCDHTYCYDTEILVYEIDKFVEGSEATSNPAMTAQLTTSPKYTTKTPNKTSVVIPSAVATSISAAVERTSRGATSTIPSATVTRITATPKATQSDITTTNYHNTSQFHNTEVSTPATNNISAPRNDSHLAKRVEQVVDDGPNLGLYIGSGVGGVVACAIIIAVSVIIYLRRKTSASQAQTSNPTNKYNNPAYTSDSRDDIEETTPRLSYSEEDYAQINKSIKSTNPVALPMTTGEVEKPDTVIYENSADDMDSSVYYSPVYQASADDRIDELVYSLAEPIEDDLVVEENELYGT